MLSAKLETTIGGRTDMDEYDELNEEATKELKSILGKHKEIEFSEEKRDGFYLKTSKGRFWFQCETDEEY